MERLTRERSHSEWSVAGDMRQNIVAEKSLRCEAADDRLGVERGMWEIWGDRHGRTLGAALDQAK